MPPWVSDSQPGWLVGRVCLEGIGAGQFIGTRHKGESERAHNVKCDHWMLLFLLKIFKYYSLVVCGGGRRNEE